MKTIYNKSKKYNKTKKYNKSKKYNNNYQNYQNGGTKCLSYIISGRHGFLFYNKENFNNYITIPENIRLILYTDFCGESCNSISSIKKYICKTNINSNNEIAYDILYPGSIIPEFYIIPGINSFVLDNVELSNCSNDVIYSLPYNKDNLKVVTLSKILNELNNYLKINNLTDVLIDLHWVVCLEIFDITTINHSVLENIQQEYNYSDIQEIIKNSQKLQYCNDSILKIYRSQNSHLFKECIIELGKNTLEILFNDISNKNIKLYLQYPYEWKILKLLPQFQTLFNIHRYEISTLLYDIIVYSENKKNSMLNINLFNEIKLYYNNKINIIIGTDLGQHNIKEYIETILKYEISENTIIIKLNLNHINLTSKYKLSYVIWFIFYSIVNLPIINKAIELNNIEDYIKKTSLARSTTFSRRGGKK
jgi:hypothetical protein